MQTLKQSPKKVFWTNLNKRQQIENHTEYPDETKSVK